MFGICNEQNEAKRLAQEMNVPYIPCKNGGIWCKVKNAACNLYGSVAKSWKLKFLIAFSILLIIINASLIANDQYNVSSDKDSTWTNSVYLSTTQLTTMGYGDVTPQTHLAKWFSSFVHLVVLFITLGLAEEFGAVTVARSNQSDSIKKEIKKDLDPIKAKLSITENLIHDIDSNVQQSFPDGIKTVDEVIRASEKRKSIINNLDKFRDKLKSKVSESKKVYVSDFSDIREAIPEKSEEDED